MTQLTEKSVSCVLCLYLHFLITFEEYFPLIASYHRNNKIFKRDKGGYPDKKALNAVYLINELNEVLDYFSDVIIKKKLGSPWA